MAMIRVWRNRVEAGTQRLSECPKKYRAGVVTLIQEDLADGAITLSDLQALVASGMMTEEEYAEITGEDYDA